MKVDEWFDGLSGGWPFRFQNSLFIGQMIVCVSLIFAT